MKKWEKPIKFLISGGTAAAVEYISFLCLHYLLADASIIIIQSLSFVLGLLTSFYLNKNWVFSAAGSTKKMFGKYLLLASINLVLSNILILLLSGLISVYIAKFITMAVVAVWNYFIFQKFIFR